MDTCKALRRSLCDWCGSKMPTRDMGFPVYVMQRADERGFELRDEAGGVVDPPFAYACKSCAGKIHAGELSVGLDRPSVGNYSVGGGA
jgi:hypothetical protein